MHLDLRKHAEFLYVREWAQKISLYQELTCLCHWCGVSARVRWCAAHVFCLFVAEHARNAMPWQRGNSFFVHMSKGIGVMVLLYCDVEENSIALEL